jgi:hypothetical protein
MKANRRIKSIREQCDHCRHFGGLGNDQDGNRIPFSDQTKGRGKCRAGVPYDDVQKRGARMIALPCFHVEVDNMPVDGVWPTCPKQSFKTPTELDAEAAEIDAEAEKSIRRIMVVRPAILNHVGVKESGKPVNDLAGKMPCPVCSKTLHYSVSSYNGHIHARCESDDCVSFME